MPTPARITSSTRAFCHKRANVTSTFRRFFLLSPPPSQSLLRCLCFCLFSLVVTAARLENLVPASAISLQALSSANSPRHLRPQSWPPRRKSVKVASSPPTPLLQAPTPPSFLRCFPCSFPGVSAYDTTPLLFAAVVSNLTRTLHF
jgi:hypothetical protein